MARSHQVTTGIGVYRVDVLAACLPTTAWHRVSAGRGAKGHRYYDWSFTALPHAADSHGGHHWLLIRRNRATGELAFYRCSVFAAWNDSSIFQGKGKFRRGQSRT